MTRLQRQRDAVRRYGEQILTLPIVHPIAVEFADDLAPKVDSDREGRAFLLEDIPSMRDRIRAETGAVVPGLRLRGNPALAFGEYVVLLFEVPSERARTVVGWHAVLAEPDALTRAGIPPDDVVAGVDPVTHDTCSWVAPGRCDDLDDPGDRAPPDVAFVIRHLLTSGRRHLHRVLGSHARHATVPTAPTAASTCRP